MGVNSKILGNPCFTTVTVKVFSVLFRFLSYFILRVFFLTLWLSGKWDRLLSSVCQTRLVWEDNKENNFEWVFF